MSTARQAARPAPAASAPAAPTVTRTSIFPKGACPAPTAIIPAVTLPAGAGADWRRQAVTEELAAVPCVSTFPRPTGSRKQRGTVRRASVRRHLRCALTGTLLAVVAVTGLSAYAAQGVADARSTAPCQAHITCR